MRDDFTPAVRSVQDKPLQSLVIVYVVSSRIAPSGNSEGSPLRVQAAVGDAAPFDVHQTLDSFDATSVTEGDAVLIGRLVSHRWVAIGKVV